MNVTHHPSGAALLRSAGAHLEVAEPENGLILGVAGGPPVEGGHWISVEDGRDDVVAAGVWTPPWNLVLSRAPTGAIEALADDLHARKLTLPGVSAPAETADAFVRAWVRRVPELCARVTMRQGIYALTRVIAPPSRASGSLRAAGPDDAPVVLDWMARFAEDAKLPAAEMLAYQTRIPAMTASRSLWLWQDGGRPVSMAFFQGQTSHGIRVSMVFTPREHRGHGYASACVSAMSAQALASGRRFCMLYTDLANPTSNALYQRIGYEWVCESVMVAFDAVTA